MSLSRAAKVGWTGSQRSQNTEQFTTSPQALRQVRILLKGLKNHFQSGSGNDPHHQLTCKTVEGIGDVQVHNEDILLGVVGNSKKSM